MKVFIQNKLNKKKGYKEKTQKEKIIREPAHTASCAKISPHCTPLSCSPILSPLFFVSRAMHFTCSIFVNKGDGRFSGHFQFFICLVLWISIVINFSCCLSNQFIVCGSSFSLHLWEFYFLLICSFFDAALWIWRGYICLHIDMAINEFRLFTNNLLYWNNISFKNTALDQQICIDHTIVADMCISSPNCITKQREWQDERSMDFQLVFLILRCDFDIQDCIYFSWISIVNVVW